MAKAAADIRSLARAQTALAIRTLTGVCGSKAAPAAARVSAAQALLDRGLGKAAQPHTGEDDKDIRVTIRNIVRAAISIDVTAIPQSVRPANASRCATYVRRHRVARRYHR